MTIKVASGTDTGLVRKKNEDSFIADEALGLFVVADGMGGHAAGDVASATACEEIMIQIQSRAEFLAGARDNLRAGEISLLLEQAIHAASDAVRSLANHVESQGPMGTTAEAALLVGDNLHLAHVGDSRTYLARGGELHLLTKDHSLINQLIESGKISSAGDVKAKFRNAVTRALGFFESVQVDMLTMPIMPGDRFLMCSDGLYRYFKDEEVLHILSGLDPSEAVEQFIYLANTRGGKDNITALIIEIVSTETRDFEQTAENLELLRSLFFFNLLDYDELVKLHGYMDTRNFRPGEVIFQEGAPGDALFIITSGKVKILKGSTELTVLNPGSHFGEMALVDNAPRSATAVAVDEVTCLILPKSGFFAILKREPITSVKLLWNLSRVLALRLRNTSNELQGLVTQYQTLNKLIFKKNET